MAGVPKVNLFDGEDEDDDGVPKLAPTKAGVKKAAEENPLSFFSFGSSGPASSGTSKSVVESKQPVLHEDTDDDDDEFFKSPPGSLKKPVKKVATSAFDFTDEDDLDLPKPVKGLSLDPVLSFKEALGSSAPRPASADPQKGSASTSQNDKQRISSLEEQLAKAQRSIKKYQEKEKADAAQLEQALQGIESNIAKYTERAYKAEEAKSRVEKELVTVKEQLSQLQAQNRQQAQIITQMNLGGVPIPAGSAEDIDWQIVQEKHQIAARLLSQASQEAKSGIDLLLKNAPVLAEVAQMLKDIGRITEERTR